MIDIDGQILEVRDGDVSIFSMIWELVDLYL